MLDLDQDRVTAAATAGESVVFGDAGRRESLLAAGLHRAAAVAITYANTPSAMRVLHNIHELEPTLPVIVCARWTTPTLKSSLRRARRK